MITKEKLISDIELQLLQSAPSDDSEISHEQIAFWIQYHINDLIRREIIDETKRGNGIPPIYIIRETGLTMSEETVTDIADADQRLYVTLTNEVLDLPRDAGLVRVLDYDLNLIGKTMVEQLESLRDLRFAKPSANNVLYYREGVLVFIEGFNTADIDFNDIIVDYVKKQDILSLADSGTVLISDQLVPVLIDMVVNRGKEELYGSSSDVANDGTDVKDPVYHQQIRRANSQQQPTETQQ
jgi:hypothetical protein